MAEDLRTTHYANGELIPDGTGIGDYRDESDPDYWFAYNDSVENISTYGRLYTWYTAADPRNVCPAGWYLPSDADWDTLETYLGGMELAGGKMKEAGTEHWMSPNEGATNESGFTALPGGSRIFVGGFYYLGTDGHWWSSTHADEGHAWYRFTSHFTSSLMRADPDKRYGLSVRCIKDTGSPGTLPSLLTLDASAITDTSALISWNVTNDGGSAILETGIYWGTEANPKENGTKLAAGTGPGQSSVSITGLSHSTIYYVTSYALNDEGESIGNEILFLTAILSDTSSISDIDGNTYRTIKLWDQWWMAENLKVTKYTDGTPIPTETDNTAWGNLTNPGYCWYNNDSAINAESYGALYNWYTVNTGNLCPTGWHVPADSEWTTLIEKLGGEKSAGGRLKEAGTAHWTSPNTGATNESGFTALPGGYRDYSGIFNGISGRGGWWTASESEYSPLNDARNRTIDYTGVNVRNRSDSKKYGFSVRCVKDSVGSGVKSFLKINNDEQDLAEVAIMYYGNERNKRIHDRSIYIFSSGHNINWETLEGTGSGAVIEFFAYNTRLEIDTGAYQFSNPDTMFTHQDCTTDYNGDGLINQDDCFYTLPDGTYFISAGSVYNSNTNINELYDNANYFQSGSLKITIDGELVSIEFNYQGLNGDEISGNYSGTPRYYNFSSKK
jgi:uncharacterized protein (TIGR02145 family)